MLQGAVIGAIVGLVVAVVMMKMRAGRGKKVYDAFRTHGLEGAREALDSWVPPVAGKVALSKLVDVIERMAGLAIIGDLETLEAEVGKVDGKLTAVVQARTIALVGLATKTEDPTPWVALLQQEADRIETEGGAMLAVVKRNTRNMAEVARELVGGPAVDPDVKNKLANYAGRMGPFSKPLIFAFLARATEASGGNPAQFTSRYKAAAQHL